MAKSGDSEITNMHYKTGCVSRPGSSKCDQDALDQILETESASRSAQPWSRLNQTTRVAKLRAFAVAHCQKNEYGETEQKALTQTLLAGLERRRLIGAREVTYNKETGAVEAVPSLVYQSQARRFTLKRSDRRVSTLKSLGRGRRKRERSARAGHKIDPDIKDSST